MYFLSWGWVETWIRNLPPDCDVSLIAGFKDNAPAVAFFIGYRESIRHGLFRARQLSLNSTPVRHLDALCIDYNMALIDPAVTLTLESLAEQMPVKEWDEFYMERCAPACWPNLAFEENASDKYNVQIIDHGRSFYVDLEKVRQNDMDYLGMLSKNKRQQIRRSLREYEKRGEIEIGVPKNPHDALNMLDELAQLHQKEWQRRGKPGAFSNDSFMKFHRELISTQFETGAIQLLCFFAGSEPIGRLYNFVYNGHVLYYQSGFNYLPGNLYRPGLVCHYLAVMRNAAEDRKTYDFLAGEAPYKESLSTDWRRIYDITVQKRKVKYAIENGAGAVYRFIKEKKLTP